MARMKSAWAEHPDYVIDVVPILGTARVRHGSVLVAESTHALRVIETDHVERLYVPEGDVRTDVLEANDHHTVCPFKGEADYWSLVLGDDRLEDVLWTYRDPFPEVSAIGGYLGVYHEKLDVEIETRWEEGHGDSSVVAFPAWGDQRDLLRLLDVEPAGPGRFVASGYHEQRRDVVEGGQLLGQAILAGAKTVPSQRVIAASATFTKAAGFSEPIEVTVEPLRLGRSCSTLQVRLAQGQKLVSPALVLTDVGGEEVMRDTLPMPVVPGPDGAEPYDMHVIGRAVRVVDGAYSPDPERVGPPELYVWLRFREDPDDPAMRQALLAQATTHWTIGAAMRPHRGIGEAQAHVSLSTGILSVAISFHDDAPLDTWCLYANRATWSGRGLCHGEGHIYARDGRLLASYSVDAMVRRFAQDPSAIGRDPSQVM